MKPVIVVEGTMEALMRELSADDGGGRPGQAAEVPLDLPSDFLRDGDPDADEDMDAGPRPPAFRDAPAILLYRVTTLSRTEARRVGNEGCRTGRFRGGA